MNPIELVERAARLKIVLRKALAILRNDKANAPLVAEIEMEMKNWEDLFKPDLQKARMTAVRVIWQMRDLHS